MQIYVSHLLTKAPLRNPLEYKWNTLQRFGQLLTHSLLFLTYLKTFIQTAQALESGHSHS